MKTYKIPNMKEILKPRWAHNPGEAVGAGEKWHKQKILEQATTPEDPKLLKKLGIKKSDRILAIAAFYASWASKLADLGAKVDYSDISKSMVNYARKKHKNKFRKYICSGYEFLPKKSKEYDWTFTFEACGGSQGLPLAYLRSLMNNKGGILVLFLNLEKPENMGGKLKSYPKIVNNLAKIYGAKSIIKRLNIEGHKAGKLKSSLPHMIYIIKTNKKARELTQQDLKALNSNKFSKESLERLNKLSKIISDEYLKEKSLR